MMNADFLHGLTIPELLRGCRKLQIPIRAGASKDEILLIIISAGEASGLWLAIEGETPERRAIIDAEQKFQFEHAFKRG